MHAILWSRRRLCVVCVYACVCVCVSVRVCVTGASVGSPIMMKMSSCIVVFFNKNSDTRCLSSGRVVFCCVLLCRVVSSVSFFLSPRTQTCMLINFLSRFLVFFFFSGSARLISPDVSAGMCVCVVQAERGWEVGHDERGKESVRYEHDDRHDTVCHSWHTFFFSRSQTHLTHGVSLLIFFFFCCGKFFAPFFA